MSEQTPRNEYSEFVLRRLHSLSGVLPLTAFICFHFFANSFSTSSPEQFNKIVDGLRSLPFLAAIEWGGLFAPFLFHMFYGLWIVYSGKSNVDRQKYARNWAYVAQRTSALVVFVFIFYHVISMKYMVIPEGRYPHGADFYSALREHFQNPFVYWWYVVGVSATVFHLANGLCTFCMTWGITVGRNSQRYTAVAMTALGLALLGLGIGSLNGFVSGGARHGEAKTAQVAVAPQQK